MAKRNGNVAIVFLVIFAVLTVALGVTTVLFYQQTTKMKTEKDSAVETAKKASADKTVIQGQLNNLKAKIGYPDLEYGPEDAAAPAAGEAPKTLTSGIKGDLDKYADANNLTYKFALNKLNTELENKDTELKAQIEKNRKLEADFTLKRGEEAQKINEHDKAKQDALADVLKTQQEKDAVSTAKQQEIQTLETQAISLADQKNQEINKHNQYVKKTDGQLTSLGTRVQKLQEEQDRAQSVGKPVGNVVGVDLDLREVYLDLGEADHLPRRTTFSVWSPDQHGSPYWKERGDRIKTDAEKLFKDSEKKVVLTPRQEGGPKAYVEVMEILGPKLSLARITMDKILEPVVRGDRLFSPVWTPGEQKHFALVGRFDMTGKGTSDRTLLIEMIKRQGGVIDLFVDDEGQIVGDVQEITVETDYLIEGIRPDATDPEDPQAKSALRIDETRRDLRSQAKRLGVEIIDQQKLYDFMGYRLRSYQYEYGEYTGPPRINKSFDSSSSTRPPGLPSATSEGPTTRAPVPGSRTSYGK